MPWAKTRASRTMHKYLFPIVAGVAARIGADIVARLANILDIACIERLAITDSGLQRTRVSLMLGALSNASRRPESEPAHRRHPAVCLAPWPADARSFS